MAGIAFIKMHGLGNDYVYIDCFPAGRPPAGDLPALAREMSDRHRGVGGDGLILIMPGDRAPVRMRIFNADGSEGEMCGNGVRCVAKYAYEAGYAGGADEFDVETGAGVIRPRVYPGPDGRVARVRVDMGVPRLEREAIPMAGPPGGRVVDEPLAVDGKILRITAVSMGNPHAVTFVDDVEQVDVPGLGRQVERHPAFPRRTNVEFVQVVRPDELIMRVWERGSGITQACGTGACATVVAGALTGRSARCATVHLPGGDLDIEWAGDGHVYMTGPAVEVFRGTYLPR